MLGSRDLQFEGSDLPTGVCPPSTCYSSRRIVIVLQNPGTSGMFAARSLLPVPGDALVAAGYILQS